MIDEMQPQKIALDRYLYVTASVVAWVHISNPTQVAYCYADLCPTKVAPLQARSYMVLFWTGELCGFLILSSICTIGHRKGQSDVVVRLIQDPKGEPHPEHVEED